MSTAPVLTPALQERLDSARQLTDSIFGLLTPEALYSRPIPERHRLIFYLGHLEAFDWNLICRKTLNVPSLNPQFDQLFEFGIDPPVGQAATDQGAKGQGGARPGHVERQRLAWRKPAKGAKQLKGYPHRPLLRR